VDDRTHGVQQRFFTLGADSPNEPPRDRGISLVRSPAAPHEGAIASPPAIKNAAKSSRKGENGDPSQENVGIPADEAKSVDCQEDNRQDGSHQNTEKAIQSIQAIEQSIVRSLDDLEDEGCWNQWLLAAFSALIVARIATDHVVCL